MDYVSCIVPFLLEHEGAWSDREEDKGGPTFCGLVLKYHPEFREKVRELALEVRKDLPDLAVQFYFYVLGRRAVSVIGIESVLEELKEVYLQELEQYRPPFPCHGFKLWASVFDASFLHGERNAVKILQTALRVSSVAPNLIVDGLWGPKTGEAYSRVKDWDSFALFYNAERIRFITQLKQWEVFGRGWIRRVVDLIEWLEKQETC